MVKTYSGKVFCFHDSIKEIPASRLMGFQVQLTQHSSCGSTFEELDAVQERIDAFYEAGRIEDARNERANSRMGFWLMFKDLNTATITLANLVKEIDGKPVSVLTDDDAIRVAKIIESTDITVQEIEDIIDHVKKKVKKELKQYIPSMFEDHADMTMAADIIDEAIFKIEHILGIKDRADELREIKNRMLDSIKPLCFESGNPANYQVEAEKAFESLCALLASKGITRPQEIPALSFYLNIEMLTKNKTGNKEWHPETQNI